MRAMGGRPMLMQRYPDGADGKSFFQKRVPEARPTGSRRHGRRRPTARTSNALVVADLAHIALGGQHRLPRLPRLALPRGRRPTTPTSCASTSTPRPASRSRWCARPPTRRAACSTELGIDARARRPPARNGIHVYARLRPELGLVRRCAPPPSRVARELERRRPDLVTAAWWKEERGERVFVDFNQNAPHKTVFGAWCVRPRVGGQVSTPFRWDELATDRPRRAHHRQRPRQGGGAGRPVGGRWTSAPQDSSRCSRCAARDLAAGLMDAPWPPVYPKMPNEPPRVAPSRAKKE